MKKICVILSIVLVSICCFCFLPGCGKYYEISSVEELYAMQSNKNYKLTCDLDLQEREWYPLKVKNFDGNGYTIKNCFINSAFDSNGRDEYGYFTNGKGFFNDISKLKNIIFDNIQSTITVSLSDWSAVGLVAGEINGGAENVTVRNSSISVFRNDTQLNEMVCVGVIGGMFRGEARNCCVENCKLTVNNTDKYSETIIAGIAGWYSARNLESCKIDNLSIETDCKKFSNIGFITGYYTGGNGVIRNCSAKDSCINATTKSEYTSRAGGIVGFAKEDNSAIEQCLRLNNQIEISSESGYNIGGIVGKNVGKTKNCLSDSNTLIGSTQSTSSSQYAGIGGLCGSNNGTISKSISQNNNITGTSKTSSKRMQSAGFVAEAEASVVDCAVYDNKINGGYKDVFTSTQGLTHDCLIVNFGQTTPNINGIELFEENEFKNLLDLLSLDKDLWSIDSLKKITLNIN